MAERVICPLGNGDCPENCPAHIPNKYLAEQVEQISGIDMTILPAERIKEVMAEHLSVLSHTMLLKECLKQKVDVGQAKTAE